MKTFLRFTFVALIAVVLSACSNNGPSAVAVEFTKALYKGDSDKAVSYCTESTQQMVGLIMGFDSSSSLEEMHKSNPNVKVISTEVSEDGNSATVKVEVTNYYDIKSKKIVKEPSEQELDLVKVNDEWKVTLKK